MARRKGKALSSKIRGAAAEMYGGGRGQTNPGYREKTHGIRVKAGRGRNRKQRKIASGRM
jgi:hypothetical protein